MTLQIRRFLLGKNFSGGQVMQNRVIVSNDNFGMPQTVIIRASTTASQIVSGGGGTTTIINPTVEEVSGKSRMAFRLARLFRKKGRWMGL